MARTRKKTLKERKAEGQVKPLVSKYAAKVLARTEGA